VSESENIHTLQELRDRLRELIGTWSDRARERRARGEMGGAIIYATVLNELRNELDNVTPRRESGIPYTFLTRPDSRPPVTLWQLVQERARSRKDWTRLMERLQDGGDLEPIEFTCDSCPHARRCKLAFDHYNTDGDCLAEK
jgi:hypothetical protein